MYSAKYLGLIGVASVLLAACGGGSSSSGGGDATAGLTDDMRGTWNGNLGTATYEMNITQATGGDSAGRIEFSNGNGGPISLAKEGNDLNIVVEFMNSDCVGRFFGRLTSANASEGNYRETGSTCDFQGAWDMQR